MTELAAAGGGTGGLLAVTIFSSVVNDFVVTLLTRVSFELSKPKSRCGLFLALLSSTKTSCLKETTPHKQDYK